MPAKRRPTAPESFIGAPDNSAETKDVMYDFFDEVLTYLGYESGKARMAFAKIEHYTLNRLNPEPGQDTPTENTVALLRVQDRVVASFAEWRDDFNYVQVMPALHLTNELTEQVRFDPDAANAVEQDPSVT